jgi:putative (di)nucleoside polyphosphate hydrolase
MKGKNYRKGVGIIIVNAKGQFFLGKRIGAEAWQFPQGGIDEGENPEEALYRELHEETGLIKDKVKIIAVSKKWLVYHIPHVYQRSNKKYDGAMQKWFLLELAGTNEDINLYASIFSEFADVLKGLKNN